MNEPVTDTAETKPSDDLTFDRQLFEEVERLSGEVARCKGDFDRKNDAAKTAKKALDAAHDSHDTAVRRFILKARGLNDAPMPLFENQSEAIARAEADPITQKLVQRLLDHQITHVNALVVYGYDAEQRRQLEDYLDALDAKADVTIPAFLAPLEPPAIADDVVIAALKDVDIEMKPEQVAAMNAEQRAETIEWAKAVVAVKLEKGDALVFDDLPQPPAYVADPTMLALPRKTDDGENIN